MGRMDTHVVNPHDILRKLTRLPEVLFPDDDATDDESESS